jgi:hypothetical protein
VELSLSLITEAEKKIAALSFDQSKTKRKLSSLYSSLIAYTSAPDSEPTLKNQDCFTSKTFYFFQRSTVSRFLQNDMSP